MDMEVEHGSSEKKIVAIVIVVAIVFALFYMFLIYGFIQDTISRITGFIMGSTRTKVSDNESVIETIRERISKIDPVVRDKAIEILNHYIKSHRVVLDEEIYVASNDYEYVSFRTYRDLVYEVRVSVSGPCFGECDIGIELYGPGYKAIKYFGRRSSLTFNLSIYGYLEPGTYYLKLDNSYSLITGKTVYVTITVYFTKYFLDDDIYKLVTIGYWVANNIAYVKDPHGLEYVAEPRETLKVKAGDCDDYAVLLASLYRSVGLRTAVGLIDTDNDHRIEHATALVYIELSKNEIMEKFNAVSQVLGIDFEAYSYFKDENGIWIIVDPAMTYGSDEPWNVDYEPYKLVYLVEPRQTSQ